ncbi:hypothetical protein [Tolumonas lignilytica]|uniref:hypothetical protein n=1 Tax=Tolumonas lignilytica TaxID=1283284 RepID=UPI000464BD33|nr:hypothetical protein [Tolumonas lignilytica]
MNTVWIKHFIYGRVILSILLGGLLLSGCSRFESGQNQSAAHNAKPSANLQNACASKYQCECQNTSETHSDTHISKTDLVAQLDDTLARTKAIQAWPFSKIDHCRREFPYHFTVVSINPAIVVGAPVQSSSAATCTSINCLRSRKFIGYYEVDDQFTNEPGLVWFSPEHGPRLFDVPAHANSIFLLIGGKAVRLKRKGNQWHLSRKN